MMKNERSNIEKINLIEKSKKKKVLIKLSNAMKTLVAV